MKKNYKSLSILYLTTAFIMTVVIYWDVTALQVDYHSWQYIMVKGFTIISFLSIGTYNLFTKNFWPIMEDYYVNVFHIYSWFGMAYIDMTYNYSFVEAILISSVFLRQSTRRFLIGFIVGIVLMLIGYNMAKEPAFVQTGESYKPHSLTVSMILFWLALITHLLIQRYQRHFMDLNEKFALIGRQSSFLMHEIKNPLSRVMANSEGEVSLTLLKDIHHDSQKISSLVTSLETLIHRPQELVRTFSTFDLSEIREILVKDYESYLHSMNIDYDFRELKGPFHGNRDLIYQLHKNLLINAIEAIGYKKNVRSLIKGQVLRNQKEALIIEFTNNNSHISEKNLNQIFEPHFSTKQDKNNKGLGLYLCRNIVEAHDGIIEAKSSNNQTTFLLRFKTPAQGNP